MTSTVEVRIGHAAPVEQKKVDDVVWDDAVWAGRQIWHETVSLRRQGRHGAVRAGRQIWHEDLWRQHRHEAVRAGRQIWHEAMSLRRQGRHEAVRLQSQDRREAVQGSRWTWASPRWQQKARRFQCPLCDGDC